jgi:hypothetical protein
MFLVHIVQWALCAIIIKEQKGIYSEMKIFNHLGIRWMHSPLVSIKHISTPMSKNVITFP